MQGTKSTETGNIHYRLCSCLGMYGSESGHGQGKLQMKVCMVDDAGMRKQEGGVTGVQPE